MARTSLVLGRGFVVRYRSREARLSDLTSRLASERPQEPDPTNFTLGGYIGPSRVIEGVSFWPRVAARLIDIVVLVFLASLAGALFGVVLTIVATSTGQPVGLMIAKYRAAGVAVFVCSVLAGVAYHTICEGLHGLPSFGKCGALH
jgi:hypothetical protein